MSRPSVDDLAQLLSEGLDLCVRARKLDEAMTMAIAVGQTTDTRCLTPSLWVQDAYDRDLAAWEERGREALARWLPVGGLRAPIQEGDGR